MKLEKPLLAGLLVGIVIILFVFATGQTFGQRCAEVYNKNTTEWCDCVERLHQGGELETFNTKER